MNNSLFYKILKTDCSVSALVLRVPVGVILAAHGAQKLFGLFGGYGLEGTGQWLASIGLEPGFLMALLSGCGEFFGGLALVIGLLTRPAAVVVAFNMLIGIIFVHFKAGLFISDGGYEYALTVFVVAVALAIQGGGRFSVDSALSSDKTV